MCEFDNPDCLNCPYDECTATDSDIQRQWKHSKKYKALDNPDNVPKKVGTHVKAIYIGTSYTEGVKRRQERYRKTDKGKENEKAKTEKSIESGKNAEKCKKYRERHPEYKENCNKSHKQRYMHRYYLEKKEECAEKQKEWQESNREKCREYSKRYREANRGKCSEYGKKYREAKREYYREYGKRYRERKKAAKDHAEAMQIMQVSHGDTLSRCGSSL